MLRGGHTRAERWQPVPKEWRGGRTSKNQLQKQSLQPELRDGIAGPKMKITSLHIQDS